jgi:hypothetical protein
MTLAYMNSQSNTGTTTVTAPASPATWNLTSLSISQAGPTIGASAKVTIYDGAVGGTVLWAAYLSAPGAGYIGTGGLGGSVGVLQDIPLPKSPQGIPGIQASPGNAMNIQVIGTGGNQVSINARFSDGLP